MKAKNVMERLPQSRTATLLLNKLYWALLVFLSEDQQSPHVGCYKSIGL